MQVRVWRFEAAWTQRKTPPTVARLPVLPLLILARMWTFGNYVLFHIVFHIVCLAGWGLLTAKRWDRWLREDWRYNVQAENVIYHPESWRFYFLLSTGPRKAHPWPTWRKLVNNMWTMSSRGRLQAGSRNEKKVNTVVEKFTYVRDSIDEWSWWSLADYVISVTYQLYQISSRFSCWLFCSGPNMTFCIQAQLSITQFLFVTAPTRHI